MAESFSKKQMAKNRAKKKQDKADKMQQRRMDNDKGKPLQDMIVYMDEDGNLTTDPDKQVQRRDAE